MRIAFVRPRLGIGGSERLILDAALELAARGHDVAIHAPDRASTPQFDAARYLPLRQERGWMPDAIAGRLRLPLAIARTWMAARAAIRTEPPYDAIVCDVVPHVISALKRRVAGPVVYYGHFPDALLATGTRAGAYAAYRAPFDRAEATGLADADRVVVNSRFTARAFVNAFPQLAGRTFDVVYPGVTIDDADAAADVLTPVPDDAIVLAALGRIDPRKNLALAIDAVAALREIVAFDLFARIRLVIAGRCDDRLPEVRAERARLAAIALERGVADRVIFDDSPPPARYAAWRRRALALVFTPLAEHLGIVPLEFMAAARPVIAVNHGGPAETIVDGETGLLVEPTAAAFAGAIASLAGDPGRARTLGAAGRARVADRFSRERFGAAFEEVVRQSVDAVRARRSTMRTAGSGEKACDRAGDS